MTITKNRRLPVVTILIALLAGFGLAQLVDGLPYSLAKIQLADDDHANRDNPGHDDDHADAGGHDHGKEGKEADHSDEDGRGHDDEEEGTVTLTARQIEASGITVVAVGRGGGHETRLAGRVESAIAAKVAVAATVSGRVKHVAVAPGTAVKEGETLVTIVSGEAATLRARADAASAEAESARLTYQRDLNLVEQGVVARQELEVSRARSLAADAAARAARAHVAAVGSPDAQGHIAIVSPLTGTVGAVGVAPGGFVSSGSVVAEVSDPARTEFVFIAPPALAAQVALGTRMNVDGPAGDMEAIVIGVAADVSERNGAALVRARPVSGALPPAGSPVAGTVVTDRKDDGLTVPADAVQTVARETVVFVATDGRFRATPVLAGRRAGDRIEILKGLSGDERIAGTNAFLLKAELAKGEAEHVH